MLHHVLVAVAAAATLPMVAVAAPLNSSAYDDAYPTVPNVTCSRGDSYNRGIGRVPRSCNGKEEDASLCYPPCADGYTGVGPVCWQGASSYGRGAGTVLECDRASEDYSAGLCYTKCQNGYEGSGLYCNCADDSATSVSPSATSSAASTTGVLGVIVTPTPDSPYSASGSLEGGSQTTSVRPPTTSVLGVIITPTPLVPNVSNYYSSTVDLPRASAPIISALATPTSVPAAVSSSASSLAASASSAASSVSSSVVSAVSSVTASTTSTLSATRTSTVPVIPTPTVA